MIRDEIVEEVRVAREEYARQFNFDLRAMGKDLRQREAASGRELVSFSPRNPAVEKKKPAAV